MPTPVTDAIDRGLGWLKRMTYQPCPSTMVIKDVPAIPLWVKNQSTGEIINCGESVYDNIQDRRSRFQAVCTQEMGGYDLGLNPVRTTDEVSYFRFKFVNTGPWWVEIETKYSSYRDSADMRLEMKMISYSSASTLEVWLGTEKIWTGNNVNDVQVRTRQFGWPGCRYVARHCARLMARIYDAVNEYQYNPEYARRAAKFHKFMNDCGFGQDYYDPIFGVDTDYDDDWLVQKATLPDPEVWKTYVGPRRGGNWTCYRSGAEGWIVRDLYQMRVPVADQMLNFSSSPNWDVLNALHITNKYGSSKASDALAYLDRAGWDGFGTRLKVILGLEDNWFYKHSGMFIPATEFAKYLAKKYVLVRPAHETYSLAVFCVAAARYWQVNGNTTYRDYARQAAGILCALQYVDGFTVAPSTTVYRNDSHGGFIGSYLIKDGTPIFKSQVGLQDALFEGSKWIGASDRSDLEYPARILTASEPTALAVAALIKYREIFGESILSLTGHPVAWYQCPAWHYETESI